MMTSMTPLKIKGHPELRTLIKTEQNVVNDISKVETDRLEARNAFQTWSQMRTDDLNHFGDILHDSFKDQRASYRQYYMKSEDLLRALSKALEEEKFLDPTLKDLQRREKALNKAEKGYRKARRSYDRATNKANFDVKALKYEKKMSNADLKRSQAVRMVDSSRETYDLERDRIYKETKHDVVVGYLNVMKQDYLLMRARIQELERVFDIVRQDFAQESEEVDIPKEKLTPILQLSQREYDEKERQMKEQELASKPRMSLEQAVKAALPETRRTPIGQRKGMQQQGAGVGQWGAGQSWDKSKSWDMKDPMSNIPEAPPVPTDRDLNKASRRQLAATA